jgi:hypothetical protein
MTACQVKIFYTPEIRLKRLGSKKNSGSKVGSVPAVRNALLWKRDEVQIRDLARISSDSFCRKLDLS